ncbi:MAG TPA: HlyD family efflux transporter periplasmic adaptor subunit [Candidatus Binatia bacterium]|nr:HlyD family efflux transporter periplasmic adaptor subunit [Candidatus Binatia bacterium]
MQRTILIPIVLLAAAAAGGGWYLRRDRAPLHYTGFVEGEERVLRSEVSARVLEVTYAEGQPVPPGEAVARLDDQDIQARINSKQAELSVLDAELHTQTERIELVSSTWQRDVSARTADLRQAESAADLAERTLVREDGLVKTGASTAQQLDDIRARRDQARSALDRAHELLAKAKAEERNIALARHELTTLQERRDLAMAQLGELQVTLSKYVIRAPAAASVVQTQFIWPGELAQPGSAILSVLDPTDKYVQVYIPVVDVGRLHIGQRVALELDSRPGERVAGEVSFIADKANFTPEKIETRSDRMGQVYRVKVRILEGVERLQPGTEGNVYLDS